LATDYPESAQDNQGKYSGEATLADLKNVDCSTAVLDILRTKNFAIVNTVSTIYIIIIQKL
jgi:hypothetical protein